MLVESLSAERAANMYQYIINLHAHEGVAFQCMVADHTLYAFICTHGMCDCLTVVF